jgi:hypothetical protein
MWSGGSRTCIIGLSWWQAEIQRRLGSVTAFTVHKHIFCRYSVHDNIIKRLYVVITRCAHRKTAAHVVGHDTSAIAEFLPRRLHHHSEDKTRQARLAIPPLRHMEGQGEQAPRSVRNG